MNSAKKILVVSKFLAPGSEVGGRRFSHLTRQFEERGFEVHAVAAALPPGSGRDPSLPEVQRLHRAGPHFHLPVQRRTLVARTINRLTRNIVAPLDPDPLWMPGALHKGRSLTAKLRPDVVIGTIPPLSAGLIACKLADAAGCPLILDYRDPWSAYPWLRKMKTAYSRGIATWLEQRCVVGSAARVFSTPEIRDWFEQYFPAATRACNYVIPNGVDDRQEGIGASTKSLEREIVYAGELYGDRSILPVLLAIAALDGTAASSGPLKLAVYGEIPASELQRVRAAGVERHLERRQMVSSVELARILRSAACLLVISGDEMTYSIPYKMYDYLASRRPILALSPRESAVHRFFRQFDVGEYADPGDQEAVTAALQRVTVASRVIDGAALEVHRWSRLASEYANVIEAVCAGFGVRKVDSSAT